MRNRRRETIVRPWRGWQSVVGFARPRRSLSLRTGDIPRCRWRRRTRGSRICFQHGSANPARVRCRRTGSVGQGVMIDTVMFCVACNNPDNGEFDGSASAIVYNGEAEIEADSLEGYAFAEVKGGIRLHRKIFRTVAVSYTHLTLPTNREV